MTGLLAFVGGQPFTVMCSFDRDLLQVAASDEVVVLPTAAAYEHPAEIEQTATRYFETFGLKTTVAQVLVRADALQADAAAIVRGAQNIYLVGTSAMHAKSVLYQSPVWDALVAAWEGGATVVGANAGAQILGDPMVDPRGGGFTVGLGLVRDIAVIPQRNLHSVESLNRSRELSGPEQLLFAIDEGTAVIRNPDGTWRVEGEGTVDVYRGGEPCPIDEIRR